MASSIYPLPMSFPTSLQHVEITVTREGWRFRETADRVIFDELPVAERLDLRRSFEAQVELAKSTPTKGDR